MILDSVLDFFRGEAITIPPLDGAFRPNTRLDDHAAFAQMDAPDNLVVLDEQIVVSSGNALLSVGADGSITQVETFDVPVTALAASPSSALAVGLESGRLSIDGAEIPLPGGINCITALAYGVDGALWLANGSAAHPVSGWVADLMEKGASGSVWRCAKGGSFTRIADELAFPYGLHPDADGVVVSESWRHRLVHIATDGGCSVVLDKLPGYPARIAPAHDSGAWLCVFAPRNRLVEFVLQEKHYRRDMMEEVPRDYWIAPALSSRRSFLEPLQCGGIKTMGVHKPWAPSRSCGMVVRLDATMTPLYSLHSRANGVRHGTCSALEHDGRLIVAAKGGDCLLSLDAAAGGH